MGGEKRRCDGRVDTGGPKADAKAGSWIPVGELLSQWAADCLSDHTRRAHAEDVSWFLGYCHVQEVDRLESLAAIERDEIRRRRDALAAQGLSPNTINRRLSSVSGLYDYLISKRDLLSVALPANPAHWQAVARLAQRSRKEAKALPVHDARCLMQMPEGDSVLPVRDRAILAFILYTRAPVEAACRLEVSDFDCRTGQIRCHAGRPAGGFEQLLAPAGGGHELHPAAAAALREYVSLAKLE
ncbi:MAG: site-specific integrase [Planctomycetota bacterium]